MVQIGACVEQLRINLDRRQVNAIRGAPRVKTVGPPGIAELVRRQYCNRRQSCRLGFPGGGGPRETDQCCGRAGGNAAGSQLRKGGFSCFVCSGSSRDLLKRFSNSSRIFDMTSEASFRLSRAISTCSEVSLPIFSLGCLPPRAAIAELSSFDDLGRIDALLTQIRPSLTCGGRDVVSRQVDKFLRRSD